MYKIGRYIGWGSSSFFFGLKGYTKLGVKIHSTNSKNVLQEEFAKAQVLRRNNISIPRHVGIVTVEIPRSFKNTIKKIRKKKDEKKIDIPEEIINKLDSWAGTVKWGMVIEIVEDATSLDPAIVPDYYNREKKKIENLGIKLWSDFSTNILWSKKKRKLYFIDFAEWKIPKHLF